MSFRTPLILSAILLVLGMTAYWLEFKKRPEDEKRDRAAKHLLAVDDQTLRSIRLKQGTQTIQIVCLNVAEKLCKPGDLSQWELAEPLKTKADDSNVNSLLSTLSGWDPTDTIDLSQDAPEKRLSLLDEYGLSEKRRAGADRTIDVEFASGMKTSLVFGIKHPAMDAYFVIKGVDGKLDETKVFLLESSALAATDKPLTYFRDKRIFTLSQNEVNEFRLKSKSGTSPIVGKLEGSDWKITEGTKSLPADTDAVNALISATLFLNAKGFTSNDQASTDAQKLIGKLPTVLEIELVTANKKQSLKLLERTFVDQGKKASVIYAISPEASPVFELDTSSLTRVGKTWNELRLRKLVQSMDRFSIDRMKIVRTGKTAFTKSLESREAKWHDQNRVLDGKPINQFLDALSGPALAENISPRANETPTEAVRIELGIGAADARYIYTFFEKNGKWWARDEKRADRALFELSTELQKTLPLTEAFLQDPKANPEPEAPGMDSPDHADGDGHDH